MISRYLTSAALAAALSASAAFAAPTLTVAPPTLAFGRIAPSTPSFQLTFTVSGTDLAPTPTGDITVTAPADFEVSLTSGSGFGSSVTVPAPAGGGAVADTAVYTRFAGSAADGAFSGNVASSSSGAVVKNVFVSASVDVTPPVSSASVTDDTQAGSVSVSFTASDNVSGLSSTRLYVKAPGAGSYVDSTLTLSGASGAFTYTPAPGVNGLYQFYTRSTDFAGNVESAPASEDVTINVNSVVNGAYTQTVSAAAETLVFPMTTPLNVSLAFTGATPGGTVTVSRTAPLSNPPAHFGHPERLLNEMLTITGSGLGGFTADLTWEFNAANAPAQAIDAVSRFDGAATPANVFTPNVTGNIITVTGVTSFSDWYAGNAAAVPVSVSAFVIE